jgi:hypothetical protein
MRLQKRHLFLREPFMSISIQSSLLVKVIALLVAVTTPSASIPCYGDEPKTVKEVLIKGPDEIQFKIRMEGPYTADVPLQVVCYFEHTPDMATRMQGAPVELDRKLGGVIGRLRASKQFAGRPIDILLIQSPPKTIPAAQVLLVGLGRESELSLEILKRAGETALRTATLIGCERVAFAPLIRDQGSERFSAKEVEVAVLSGVLSGYKTELELQKTGYAKSYRLREWWIEAGPTYFDETVAAVQQVVSDVDQ